MDRRRRAALALVTTLLLAGCASASSVQTYPHGDERESLTDGSLLRTALIYVIAPLVVSAIIAALVWLPGTARGSRYRPQFGWTAPPLWIAGPADPVAAVESAETGDLRRGGAGGSW